MAVLLVCVIFPAILWIAARFPNRFAFALASLLLLTTAVFLLVGYPLRATIFAGSFAIAITGASKVKHHHSGRKLTFADLALSFSGTVPFMLRQYRGTAILSLVGFLALCLATTAIVAVAPAFDIPLSLGYRLTAFLAASVIYLISYRAIGGPTYFNATVSNSTSCFSDFIASLLDLSAWWRNGGLRLIDISNEPLRLSAALPGQQSKRPDIIVIQHESLFDPRIFGLPIEPEIKRFFEPPGGTCGPLHVEIYGGGSWQSEFSLLTGLSSRSFGPDAYFLFRKGVDRFRHSLPLSLAGLGYRTTLVAGCSRRFMNYDAFYSSIGVDDRFFTEDFPPPFESERFDETGSDTMLLEAARRRLEDCIESDAAPRFLMVLTNANHGPHNRRQSPPGRFESERNFAWRSLPDIQYAEYYARLAETVASWDLFKTNLAARFPERSMLVVHYGDHQPVMTRRIESALGLGNVGTRQFTTFYCIEGINIEPKSIVAENGRALDIAFLGTVALQAAQLPLDPIFATRASLIADCGVDYFASKSIRKSGFHRSLVDLGIIDCASNARRSSRRGVDQANRDHRDG